MLHSRHALALSAVALLALGLGSFGTGTLGTGASTARTRAAENDADEDDALAKGAARADSAAVGDAPKYDLQYKFKAGEVLRWEIVHRAVVDSTIQGTNQTAETRSKSVKAWQVDEVSPEGNITLVHSVDSIDMWQKMQGRQEVRYNSLQDEKAPAGYEDVAKAVGVVLTVFTIDNRGNVIEREDKHPQPNARSTLITIPLPAEPVAVGHTWSAPLEFDVLLHGMTKKIQTRQRFTLQKVADGLATIEVDSQVLTPIHDPAIEAQLIQRLTCGTLKFDIEDGRVVSQQMDLDRRVIGFSGASSSMHYLTRFTEELLPGTAPATAATKKPAPAAVLKQPTSVSGSPSPPAKKPARR